MAVIYSYRGKRQLERVIGLHRDVQNDMRRRLFAARARAGEILKDHRQDGNARIETAELDVDMYLILADTVDAPSKENPRGGLNLNTAASIELGRKAGSYTYIDRRTGEEVTIAWPDQPGLYILHRAWGIDPQTTGRQRVT